MATARIGARRQITIPKDAIEELGLQPGDVLYVRVERDGLTLVPRKLVPRDQAWYWTDEWQAMEREADEAIAAGDVSRPFSSVAELLGYLDSECVGEGDEAG